MLGLAVGIVGTGGYGLGTVLCCSLLFNNCSVWEPVGAFGERCIALHRFCIAVWPAMAEFWPVGIGGYRLGIVIVWTAVDGFGTGVLSLHHLPGIGVNQRSELAHPISCLLGRQPYAVFPSLGRGVTAFIPDPQAVLKVPPIHNLY